MELITKEDKQKLFETLGIGIVDIIQSCERKSQSNLDMNLTNVVLNKELTKIIEEGKIKRIFFSSRFVEKLFQKFFKELICRHPVIEFITLPSPSPRFAAMSKS